MRICGEVRLSAAGQSEICLRAVIVYAEHGMSLTVLTLPVVVISCSQQRMSLLQLFTWTRSRARSLVFVARADKQDVS
jgi:hypothetical protein